jgi:hypothetical protein
MGSETTSAFSVEISFVGILEEKAIEMLLGARSLLAWAPFCSCASWSSNILD